SPWPVAGVIRATGSGGSPARSSKAKTVTPFKFLPLAKILPVPSVSSSISGKTIPVRVLSVLRGKNPLFVFCVLLRLIHVGLGFLSVLIRVHPWLKSYLCFLCSFAAFCPLPLLPSAFCLLPSAFSLLLSNFPSLPF